MSFCLKASLVSEGTGGKDEVSEGAFVICKRAYCMSAICKKDTDFLIILAGHFSRGTQV